MSLIAELTESQDAETALYISLKRPGISESERASIIQQINEQSAIRAKAFANLTKAYVKRNAESELLTEATTQQIDALKLVEQQLNDTKSAMADKRLEALKMVEITAYSGKQYQAYASILSIIAIIAIIYAISTWITIRFPTVPFVNWLPKFVLLCGVIYIVIQCGDLLLRRNDSFDEYEWPVAPRTKDMLTSANSISSKTIIHTKGIPTLCAGSFCCGEGTEWTDSAGCVISASNPTKTPSASLIDGQELVHSKLK